jgi:hypothetical protein
MLLKTIVSELPHKLIHSVASVQHEASVMPQSACPASGRDFAGFFAAVVPLLRQVVRECSAIGTALKKVGSKERKIGQLFLQTTGHP